MKVLMWGTNHEDQVWQVQDMSTAGAKWHLNIKKNVTHICPLHIWKLISYTLMPIWFIGLFLILMDTLRYIYVCTLNNVLKALSLSDAIYMGVY